MKFSLIFLATFAAANAFNYQKILEKKIAKLEKKLVKEKEDADAEKDAAVVDIDRSEPVVVEAPCTTVIDQVWEEECFTVYDNACEVKPFKKCSFVDARECGPVSEEKCSIVFVEKCHKIPIPFCNIHWEKTCTAAPVCNTVHEPVCHTLEKDVCITHIDKVCSMRNEKVCIKRTVPVVSLPVGPAYTPPHSTLLSGSNIPGSPVLAHTTPIEGSATSNADVLKPALETEKDSENVLLQRDNQNKQPFPVKRHVEIFNKKGETGEDEDLEDFDIQIPYAYPEDTEEPEVDVADEGSGEREGQEAYRPIATTKDFKVNEFGVPQVGQEGLEGWDPAYDEIVDEHIKNVKRVLDKRDLEAIKNKINDKKAVIKDYLNARKALKDDKMAALKGIHDAYKASKGKKSKIVVPVREVPQIAVELIEECHDEPRKHCVDVPREACHKEPIQDCRTEPREVCVEKEKCSNWPKKDCGMRHKETCVPVPTKKCTPVTRNVCQTVQREECRHVDHEVCTAVPSKECQKKLIPKPRQVCTRTTERMLEDW